MTTLFNLPSSILSEIYKMDSTYRDIFQRMIIYEIFVKSFDKFRENYVLKIHNNENYSYLNPLMIDDFLKYAFKLEVNNIKYNMPSTIKQIDTDINVEDIRVYIAWNGDNNGLYMEVVLHSNVIFSGTVFTVELYNNKLALCRSNMIQEISMLQNIVFRNDKFIIVPHLICSVSDNFPTI